MPAMTVTAQRERGNSCCPNPYSTTANVGQFDVRQIAPFLLSPVTEDRYQGLHRSRLTRIRNTENETERLRLSSFGNIIQGEEVSSQINYREAAGQLTKAQADVLRAQQPHVVPKMLAEIDQSREAASAHKQTRLRSETLTPLEAKQQIAQLNVSGQVPHLPMHRLVRVKELVQFEKDNFTANINQSNAAAGYSRAHTKQIEDISPLQVKALQKDIDQYVEMEIGTEPGKKQQFTLKGPRSYSKE